MTVDLAPLAIAADRDEPPTLIVYVSGDVDMATAPTLHNTVEQSLVHPVRLVVELSGVTFVDSSGLAVLVDLRRIVEEGDERSTLSLAGLSRTVERLFAITHLLEVFTVIDSVPRSRGRLAAS